MKSTQLLLKTLTLLSQFAPHPRVFFVFSRIICQADITPPCRSFRILREKTNHFAIFALRIAKDGLRTLFPIVVLSLSAAAFGATLPHHSAVPGGVAVIPLDINSPGPEVFYKNQRVLALEANEKWYAVVGIPLSAKTGPQQITVREANGNEREIAFDVKDKAYETQHITIKDKRKVTPNEDDLKRIRKEKQKIVSAFRQWRDTTVVETDFLVPVEGVKSSSFGLRRFFNQQPRRPHSGMDIAAAEGTLIQAPAPGQVILTGDFFFNGHSVFVDHGQGLVTMYCHLSRIDVDQGQTVKRGEVLGAVGKTGRVTGPHLHWTVSLNDARVDPALFIEATTTAANP